MQVAPGRDRSVGRKIVLASTSRRRKEILSLLGVPFQIVPPPFEERSDPHRSAREEAMLFSEEKARSVAPDFPESVIIGSDTLIECDNKKIGKPRDKEDAKRILEFLRGKKHHIWTAVALIDASETSPTPYVEATRVAIWMKRITDYEIQDYVSTEEPLDKAGAYSLQGEGRRFINHLEGDYLAAVGLPLKTVAYFLEEREIRLPFDVDQLYREKGFLNWKTF